MCWTNNGSRIYNTGNLWKLHNQWGDYTKYFKTITKTKEILHDSRPHAEMVYWALNKAKADWTEEERAKYEGMMKDALTNLEKFFAKEDVASCS